MRTIRSKDLLMTSFLKSSCPFMAFVNNILRMYGKSDIALFGGGVGGGYTVTLLQMALSS